MSGELIGVAVILRSKSNDLSGFEEEVVGRWDVDLLVHDELYVLQVSESIHCISFMTF